VKSYYVLGLGVYCKRHAKTKERWEERRNIVFEIWYELWGDLKRAANSFFIHIFSYYIFVWISCFVLDWDKAVLGNQFYPLTPNLAPRIHKNLASWILFFTFYNFIVYFSILSYIWIFLFLLLLSVLNRVVLIPVINLS